MFDLSGPVNYKTFSLTAPERLIIDLSGAGLSGDFSQLVLKNSGITSIRSGHFGKADTRIVLDLATPMQLTSFLLPPGDGQGHRLVLDLNQRHSGASPDSGRPQTACRQGAPQA